MASPEDFFAPKPLSVLIVEDEPAVAKALSRHLEGMGAKVTVQANLTDSKKSMEAADVVLLDLCLPDSGGLRTVKRALEMTDRPLVILTGSPYVEPADDERAIVMGAQDWINKTDLPKDLLLRLRLAVVRWLTQHLRRPQHA